MGRILDEATGLQGRDPRAEATNATWTSVGLMSLTATLAAAYSVTKDPFQSKTTKDSRTTFVSYS